MRDGGAARVEGAGILVNDCNSSGTASPCDGKCKRREQMDVFEKTK